MRGADHNAPHTNNMTHELNTPVIADIIMALREATTVNQIARLTRLLLKEVGVLNTHTIGLEIARQAITNDPSEGRVVK